MSAKPFVLESVEARRMMSVVPVLNTNDSGAGSLRAAVLSAAVGDVIDARGISGTITLTSGQIAIDNSVTILGSGQDNLTIDANHNGRVFNVNNDDALVVKDLTLANGTTDTSGGAILNRGTLQLDSVSIKDNTAFLFGGGVYSAGASVTLNNSTFSGNTVTGALEASGGGLYMQGGTLTVNGTTFSQNQAIGASNTGLTSGPGYGGAIYLKNTLASSITNSTFGDNAAVGGTGGLFAQNGQAYGGAIYTNTSAGTLLNHCTIAYNDATGGGTILAKANSQGGGVYSVGTGVVSMVGTIAALNSAMTQPDVINSLLNLVGDNLIGIYTGSSILNGLLGNLLGTVLAPTSPGLTALANHGGDTMTYGLASNSLAVNAGDTDAPVLDQRGLFRRDAADAGAFELNANHMPEIVSTSQNAVAGSAYSQAIAVVDADNDALVVGSTDKPAWMSIKNIAGVWTLVGRPSELDANATTRFHVNVFDGFQTNTTIMNVKVGIPGIDLSDSGLLRLNGTEFDDELSITLNKDGNTVRVFRDGFKRNFALDAVKKIQVFGFGGNDNVLIDIGKVRGNIFGGDGNDVIKGGAGAEYITGGAGDDIIEAGFGADRVDGDDGRDRILGQAGDDTLHGGAGRDIIDGGIGRNRLFGDGGNDTFYATLGLRDVIYGGDGNNNGAWAKNTTVIDAVLA